MMDFVCKGNWKQLKGKIKEQWGRLTDDELTRIDGKRDQLLGRLQAHYGWDEKKAESELVQFEQALIAEEKALNPIEAPSQKARSQDLYDEESKKKAG
jgi:uncharacterized protein YjbJ (UPF0337 family)